MANSVEKEIIELAKKLITFKSTKGNPKELDNCLNFCEKYLKKFAVVKRFKFKGKPSLVATYKNVKPEVFLVGHLDVVEAPDAQFKPFVKGNKLFGRGADDMKGGDAIAMVLFKHLADKKPALGLMLTADEEIGGLDGAGQLAKKYKGKFVITTESNSSENPKQLGITIKHKGVLWLKIKTKGKAAHGSTPWKGDNAIDKLIIAYERLREKFYEVKPNMWEPTISLGQISGGEAPNKIPDYAEAIVDIRWNEDFDKDKFMKKIKSLDAEFEVIAYSPMLDNDETDERIKLLKECVENQTGKKCPLLKEYGSTDMRFFSEKGVPAVIFGPYGENLHAKNEYLDLNTVMIVYNVLREFILKC
jgi:succinyl-diaminopimelate desuccinylase